MGFTLGALFAPPKRLPKALQRFYVLPITDNP